MPVFAQICSADPIAFDEGAMFAVSTCTCGADGGDLIMESTDDDYSNSTNASSLMVINIDGIDHLTTCAFALSATNGFNLNTLTLTPAQRSILILKQQQQQLIAGLALLRKQRQPLVSGEATTKNGALGATRQQVRREKKDPFDAVRLLPSRISHLYAGSRFQGRQKSGSNSYEVMVDIKVSIK
jgi:hypothetical protein